MEMTRRSVAAKPADEAPTARRRRKDARPAELIEAGLQEFATHGFAATRLEDVARRAGVAKGTIYLYFADKEALFIAAARSRVLPILDGMAEAVDAYPGTTRDLLRAIFETMHRHMVGSDLRVLLRIIIGEGQRFPALTEFYYRETIAKARALIERVIARGIARGEVRPNAAAHLPLVLVAPAVMATVWRLVFEPYAPIAAEDFLAAHCDLVFEGLLYGDERS